MADEAEQIIQPELYRQHARERRSIVATCETCQHEAVLNADRWPADMPVPDTTGFGRPRL